MSRRASKSSRRSSRAASISSRQSVPGTPPETPRMPVAVSPDTPPNEMVCVWIGIHLVRTGKISIFIDDFSRNHFWDHREPLIITDRTWMFYFFRIQYDILYFYITSPTHTIILPPGTPPPFHDFVRGSSAKVNVARPPKIRQEEKPWIAVCGMDFSFKNRIVRRMNWYFTLFPSSFGLFFLFSILSNLPPPPFRVPLISGFNRIMRTMAVFNESFMHDRWVELSFKSFFFSNIAPIFT